MTLISDLKLLEKIFTESREAMRVAYCLKFAFRKAQKDLKGKVIGDYKKYSRIARKEAKKNKPRGRGQADHIISVYAGFILGIPDTEISRSNNLELISKVDNNRKGLKSDWSRFKDIFPEYLHLIKEQQ
jgi:hypothetical protein